MKNYISAVVITLLLLCTYNTLKAQHTNGITERAYLVKTLTHIADPVLINLSQNKLKANMPVEAVAGQENDRKKYTYLEAVARLLAGMAPWLELGADNTAEGMQRQKYIGLALKCIHNATDPQSPDFMNFTRGGQPLVDAAFLAEALLRAPQQLWAGLDKQTQANVIACLKTTRAIRPPNTNWLLFSATVEAGLLKFTGTCDTSRIDYAIKKHLEWYKGDGTYGDGPDFHWDYYNSFVIQPMLIEVLQTLTDQGVNVKSKYDLIFKRARRYAAVQERMISPEGTYPPVGRSLAYRFGAFQVLAKMAYLHALPVDVTEGQVRAALYTIIKRQAEAPNTFDKNGWLQVGIYGHQPGIGESYISTGSLYLCSQAFIILGLKSDDTFWTTKDADWTAKKVWKGEAISIDHAIEN